MVRREALLVPLAGPVERFPWSFAPSLSPQNAFESAYFPVGRGTSDNPVACVAVGPSNPRLASSVKSSTLQPRSRRRRAMSVRSIASTLVPL